MGVRKNKKIREFNKVTAGITFLLLLGVLFLLLPTLAGAGEVGLGGLEYGTPEIAGTIDARLIVFRILRIILGILGLLALAIIIYGGWLWMSSTGRSEQVDKAKAILRDGIIGLVIIIAAFAIVQFLISQFYRIFGTGPGGGPTALETTFGGGALGDGPIRSVYPEPNQRGVPRNTLIIVTFKQDISPESIIADSNGSGILGDDCSGQAGCPADPFDHLLSDNVIQIFRQEGGAAGSLPATKVNVLKDPSDNQTFVFDPVDLLGEPDEWIWYATTITDEVKYPDGKSLFDGLYQDSYTWKYQVSNMIDVSPPQVHSYFPWEGEWPRNVIIRIDFSEAMNPLSVSGLTSAFKNILVQDESGDIPGKFVISNQYKTVEFFPEAKCEGVETNSCGDPVYCLPGNAEITVTIKPAPLNNCTLEEGDFFRGATDAAVNSLDGDKDNDAEGCRYDAAHSSRCASPGDSCLGDNDHYEFIFKTNNKIDLIPPKIAEIKHEGAAPLYPPESLSPAPSSVSLTAPVRMTFDKLMLSSYLRPDGKYGDEREYIYLLNPTNPVGYSIANTVGDGCSRDCLREGSLAADFKCGDGVINVSAGGGGEDCDDGNIVSGDGCSADCLHEGNAVCGNGKTERGEDQDCDLGIGSISPGCYSPGESKPCTKKGSSICGQPLTDVGCCRNGMVEQEAGEECDQSDPLVCDQTTCLWAGTASPVCGNFKIDPGEDCDDGNSVNGDGCSANCLNEGAFCGNSLKDGSYEECDGGTGCAWNCLVIGNPETGVGQCGDGMVSVDLGEECDDGASGLGYQETKVYLNHDDFMADTTYGAKVGSGVRDSFQNCFYPSSGPGCTGIPDCVFP